MSGAAPARLAALQLVSERRRRGGRVRDIARVSAALGGLSDTDRALAMRLAMGTTAAEAVLDTLLDGRLRRPSAVEPRVRDALRLATFEACYLDTPPAVAASQGVELVRRVSPRAAGLANAVLRRVATEVRPQVGMARARCADGSCDVADLELVSGIPAWLVGRILADRGLAHTRDLCLAQLEPAPVCVAANGLRHDEASLEAILGNEGMDPVAIGHLPGSFVLGRPAALARSGLVQDVDLVVCDPSAQLVCRLAMPGSPCDVLEVGQGRGTKSILLAAGVGTAHAARVIGVDSVGSKVRGSANRMRRAGLGDVVSCLRLDARDLSEDDLPPELGRTFDLVLVDAPCSGTGTMRRHPEIASALSAEDVADLASLQAQILEAAASRVRPGGTLAYATCSVLRQEDEDVVAAFLGGPAGSAFLSADVLDAPDCAASPELAARVREARTPEGSLVTHPVTGGPDGHFLALMRRVVG